MIDGHFLARLKLAEDPVLLLDPLEPPVQEEEQLGGGDRDERVGQRKDENEFEAEKNVYCVHGPVGVADDAVVELLLKA